MSGTHGALRLIELTSARVWHDIGALVGSLDHVFAVPVNGARLPPDQEEALLNTAHALSTRLELRRNAWGPENEALTLVRLQTLSRGLPAQVEVDIAALDPNTVFPMTRGRIVLNLVLLAAESLPSGGTIVLAGHTSDLFVRLEGPAAAWPSGLAVCIADETAARAALTEGISLQMALTALLAHAAGIRLSVLHPPIAQNEPPILRLGG